MFRYFPEPDARQYSVLFSCIHDDPTDISIVRILAAGRGWAAPYRVQDLCIDWDEDHDTRVIEVIERMLLAGLLKDVLMIGESKGCLTVRLHPHTPGIDWRLGPQYQPSASITALERRIDKCVPESDPWSVNIEPMVTIDSYDPGQYEPGSWQRRRAMMLAAIDARWTLGHKDHAFSPVSNWHDPDDLVPAPDEIRTAFDADA